MKKKRIYRLRRIGVKSGAIPKTAQETVAAQQEDPFARQRKLMAAEYSWLGRWLRYRVDPDHFCLIPQLPEDGEDLPDVTGLDDWYEDWGNHDEY